MLLTDKSNRNYAYVLLDDVLSCMENTDKNNLDELTKYFHSLNYEDGKIRVSKRSKIYGILKTSPNVINGDTFITPTMLAESYARASLEFNYEMKDRLFKYMKRYVDNMSENISNEKLIQKILCDEKAMNYIHKFNSFEDYTKYLIGTRIKKYEEEKKEKNKSYVRI